LGENLPWSRETERIQVALLISIAATVAEAEGVERGADLLEQARIRVEELGDPALLVKVHCQRAFIAARTGGIDEAMQCLDAAERLIAYAEPDEQFTILLNGGNLRMFRGELSAARRQFARAVEHARANGVAGGAFKALHNLGYVEFLAGRLPQAIRAMDDAGALAVDVSRGVWLLDRARVLAEAGLIREADESLADAATIFRQDRATQDLAETELERARAALVNGDAEAARRLAMRARDRFRRRGSDRWRRSAELVLLQGDLAAGRPGKRLTGPALRLRQEFERDGVRLPAQTAALIAAEAHLVAGQPDAARVALDGLPRGSRRDPITTRLHAHYVRARLEAATGQPAAASRRARKALDELAAYQASFGSIDLATAAAVHGRRLAELDLAVALQSGRPSAVLVAAERGRAVTNRLLAVRPPADPEAAELLAELRQTVEALRAAEFDRAASAPLEQRRRELEARIASRGWTRAGAGVVRELVPVDELRNSLGDTTLVSFSRSDGVLHAVVVAASGLRRTALGPADAVVEQVRRVRADLDVLAHPGLPGPMRAAVTASLDRSLATLDSAVIEALQIDGRVVIVSTGMLGQLAWGLLPSLRGVPVVVAPSATAWHAAHTLAPSRHRGVVAVAGPDLDRGVPEAQAVARIWQGEVLADATGAEFADAMARARIAHIAAHGVHQTDNPLFSSLRLADGPLFAHELDQTARTPDHVVLSACELGLATVRPGDEALGLTSVLLRLGTRSVVAGVARVGDELAEQTMADYHARLAGGADSAAALAEAVARRRVPFVCFGAAYRANGRC
jgi:CHAT domain/MalT-like TPR region